jgi:RES domain-containing protein
LDKPADLTISYEVEPGVVVASGFIYAPRKPRPLWGIGSIKNGGRYNKRDTFEVIYLAEDPITALAEVGRVLTSNLTFSKIKGPPLVYISVEGILDKTLDLTAADIQNGLATSHQELTGAWIFEQDKTGEAPTQRLGRVAFDCNRFCGLRFPSAKNPGGVCVAAFPDRLSDISYLEVFDPFGNLAQRLPA